jgi:hypothetical protein
VLNALNEYKSLKWSSYNLSTICRRKYKYQKTTIFAYQHKYHINTAWNQKAIQHIYLKNIEKFLGNNPMVGATVACAVAVEEASK